MDFGVATLTRGALGNRKGYLAAAEAAERLGYGFISVNDHIVVPRDIASRYPYSESGEWAARTAGECLDQLATLAFLAARTERLRLLTSVMVVPQRHPVLTAKMLATIDVLSAGRLIVGCGVGWLKEEFEAVGAPAFAERGRVTDEYLDAFKVLWTAGRRRLSRQARSVRRTSCSAQAGAEAASADLDRRREPARHEAGGARRRRLVSRLQQPAVSPGHRRTAWRGGAASCARIARGRRARPGQPRRCLHRPDPGRLDRAEGRRWRAAHLHRRRGGDGRRHRRARASRRAPRLPELPDRRPRRDPGAHASASPRRTCLAACRLG